MEAAILDAEPSLGHGVGGALKLAMSKGYLQKEDSSRPSASRFAHLQAQNYSIEDKTYGYVWNITIIQYKKLSHIFEKKNECEKYSSIECTPTNLVRQVSSEFQTVS